MSTEFNKRSFFGQRNKFRTTLTLVATALLVLLLVAACGSAPSDSSTLGQSVPVEQSAVNIDTLAASGPPVTFSGRGRTATDEIAPPSPFSKVTFVHNGSSNFIVRAYYDGESTMLVNEIGDYSGATLIIAESTVMFDIDADGTWNARLEGVGRSSGASFNGSGDQVSGFFHAPPNNAPWEITHDGRSNFVVRLHCWGGSRLIANEIGAFSGSTIVQFSEGPCLWEVTADGRWSLNPR
jgi:hypothetical protein